MGVNEQHGSQHYPGVLNNFIFLTSKEKQRVYHIYFIHISNIYSQYMQFMNKMWIMEFIRFDLVGSFLLDKLIFYCHISKTIFCT